MIVSRTKYRVTKGKYVGTLRDRPGYLPRHYQVARTPKDAVKRFEKKFPNKRVVRVTKATSEGKYYLFYVKKGGQFDVAKYENRGF